MSYRVRVVHPSNPAESHTVDDGDEQTRIACEEILVRFDSDATDARAATTAAGGVWVNLDTDVRLVS